MGIVDVPLCKLFDIDKAGGKAIYTKAYCNAHPGNVPVYGASATTPLGFVDKADYPKGYLTWSRNGLAGYISLMKEPFCITADRGVLIPLPEISSQLNIKYIKNVAEPLFRSSIKGRLGDNGRNEYTKLHPSMIRDLLIPLPIKEDGTYDFDEQSRLAGKYEMIDEKKSQLMDLVDELLSVTPIIKLDEMIDVPLLEIFDLNNGSSKYTHAYVNSHPGKYKLYSAHTDGQFMLVDSYDYDGSFLTWSKDGLAGYMMVHENEKFSITGHRSILIPKKKDNLNLSYVKGVLEPIFRGLVKGRLGELGKNEYTTLNLQMIKAADIKIPMPIDENGEFDVAIQNAIAEKFRQISETKRKLKEKAEYIKSVNVIVE